MPLLAKILRGTTRISGIVVQSVSLRKHGAALCFPILEGNSGAGLRAGPELMAGKDAGPTNHPRIIKQHSSPYL